jgi:DNA polymerase III sliding clamp (beta) subunit (PCNA family)
MIGFEGGGRRTTTRLLGGEFPPYRALLPGHAAAVGELATAPFSEAVKRVALVAERNTALRLSFTPGQAVLEAGTGDEAQAVEVLDASYEFTGDPEGGQPGGPDAASFGPDGLEAAFNPHYLLDGLTAAAGAAGPSRHPAPHASAAEEAGTGEGGTAPDGPAGSATIRLEFTSPARPALITLAGDDGAGTDGTGAASAAEADAAGAGDAGAAGRPRPAFRYLVVPLRPPVRG